MRCEWMWARGRRAAVAQCPLTTLPAPHPSHPTHLGSISERPGVGLGKYSWGSYLRTAGAVGDTPLQ